jgi:hypothetical protein
MTRTTTILLSLLLATPAFAQERGQRPTALTMEQESEMGRKTAAELEQKVKFKDDPVVTK